MISGINSSSVPLTANMVTWNDALDKSEWQTGASASDIVGLTLPLKDSMVELKRIKYSSGNPVAVGDLLLHYDIYSYDRYCDRGISSVLSQWIFDLRKWGTRSQDSSNGGTEEFDSSSKSNGSTYSWANVADPEVLSITLTHTKADGTKTQTDIGSATEIIVNETGQYSVSIASPTVYIASTNVVEVDAIGEIEIPVGLESLHKHIGVYKTGVVVYNGGLYATGKNAVGAYGDGTTDNSSDGFKLVSQWSDDIAFVGSSGEENMFIVKHDNTLWSTGANNHGQLGIGSTTHKSEYTQVPGFNNTGDLPDIVYVNGGGSHTLSVTLDGKVIGWGQNVYGEARGTGNLNKPK